MIVNKINYFFYDHRLLLVLQWLSKKRVLLVGVLPWQSKFRLLHNYIYSPVFVILEISMYHSVVILT